METEGYIHSIQTFGTLDGPGVRYVIFMQGCAMRCIFCHNPDTWRMVYGKLVSVDWLVKDIKNYIPFFQSSGGGVTASGGEPLLQADFLATLFKRLGKLKIHRVIDTCGSAEVEKVTRLLEFTDLVMLSIKSPEPEDYRKLTGTSAERTLRFARYLNKINMPVWIRYVLIPEVNDSPSYLTKLAEWTLSLPNIQKLEILPYNDLGVSKWKELGMKYPLPDVKPPSKQEAAQARDELSRLLPSVKVY